MALDKLLFGNNSYQLLRGALDAAALRQKVIADNVANAETPGFRPHEVAFEELLNQASGGAPGQQPPLAQVAAGSALPLRPAGGTSIPRPQVIESPRPEAADGTPTEDGFDMERAMADLNSNRIQFSALTQLVSNRLIALKSAIESR